MQKLDFVQAVEKVCKDMFSDDVVNDIDVSLTPGLSKYGPELAVMLWDMFSNYNALKKDKQYSPILSALNGDELFTAENISKLFQLFQGDIGQIDVLKNREFRLFLDFHYTLKSTNEFVKKLLSQKKVRKSLGEEGKSGIVIFQVHNESEGLSTKVYVNIFEAIETLVLTIGKIIGEDVSEPNIILLDSGSDVNIGVETAVMVGTAMYVLFKHIHDFLKYGGNEKADKDNKTMLDSLTLLSEIKKKVDEGLITEDEGKTYTFRIKSTIRTLIGNKVMPRELNEVQGINVAHLLSGGPLGLLGEGDNPTLDDSEIK